jgi:hypothetical protein
MVYFATPGLPGTILNYFKMIKKYFILVIAALFMVLQGAKAYEEYEIKFDDATIDASNHYLVTIYIRATQTNYAFQVGTSDITFNFDNTALNNPKKVNVSTDFFGNPITYNCDGFDLTKGTNYGEMKVNQSGSMCLIGIDLANCPNMALQVNTTWIPIVRIQFDIIDPSGQSNLSWRDTLAPLAPLQVKNETCAGKLVSQGSASNLNTNPLPVEWLYFDVVADMNNAILDWATAQEINNYGFQIQRYNEDYKDWMNIGFVYTKAPGGYAEHVITYEYIDKDVYDPSMGIKTFYYRLKQIDNNGNYDFSEVKSLSFFTLPQEIEVRIYPNPASDLITFEYDASQLKYFDLYIYDQNGRLVREMIKFSAKTLDVSYLPQGYYELFIREGEKIISREKLVIAR